MRRSREQEPIMNVYPPPGEPAVRTDASDFHSLRPCDAAPCRQGGGTVVRAACRARARGSTRATGCCPRSYPAARRALCALQPSGVLTLAGGAYFVACALSGRGGVGSAVLELLPYDGENALDFARARAGLIPPDAFGALSYSFVLEKRAARRRCPSLPSVDDGQPLTALCVFACAAAAALSLRLVSQRADRRGHAAAAVDEGSGETLLTGHHRRLAQQAAEGEAVARLLADGGNDAHPPWSWCWPRQWRFRPR